MTPREPEPLLGTSDFRVLIGRRELRFATVGRVHSVTDDERGHRYETVVLRRALTRSTELYDWRRRIVEGRNDRRDVTVHQLGAPGGEIVNSWRLVGAWPCRWSGPSFDAADTGIAFEEVELAFHDLLWLEKGA